MTTIVYAAVTAIIFGSIAAVKYRNGKNFFIAVGISAIGLLLGYFAKDIYNGFKLKAKYSINGKAKIMPTQSTSNTITWAEAETIISNSSEEEIGTKASNKFMGSYVAKKLVGIDYAAITKSNLRDPPDYDDTS